MDQHELLTAIKLIQKETEHITTTLDKQYKSIETIRESYATRKDLQHLEDRIKLSYDKDISELKNNWRSIKQINWIIVAAVISAILGLVLTK